MGTADRPLFGNRFRQLAAKRGILLLNLTSHNCDPRLLKSIGLMATH